MSEARPLITFCAHNIYSQRALRCGRVEAASAAEDKARRRLLERSLLFFFVLINKHFASLSSSRRTFPSRISLFEKAGFTTCREESIKSRTEVTGKTNRLEIQENTKRPLGKYKKHQLSISSAGIPASLRRFTAVCFAGIHRGFAEIYRGFAEI